MKQFFVIGCLVALGLAGIGFAVWAVDYLALTKPSALTDQPTIINQELATQTAQNNSTPPVKIKLELVAQDLFVPWSIVFSSQNRLLVSERNGRIRQVVDDKLQAQPIYTFTEVKTGGEEGLMGLALDPNYAQNHYIYACLAYEKSGGLVDKVVRLTDFSTHLAGQTTILDDIPAAQFHAGCRLGFGPDQKLYISTGDATNKELAQEKTSLAGKILRINADGTIPGDNPFPNSPLWSYGHRNPQGITWHPQTKALLETEHGPSVFDGPAGGDEINQIVAGENYGWPLVSHQNNQPGLTAPLITFTPAVAPGSANFYASSAIPQFTNHLFFGALIGEGLINVTVSPTSPHTIVMYDRVPEVTEGRVGRIRDVVTGPAGELYFTTSNTDGRGEERPNDDKIYRLVPVK